MARNSLTSRRDFRRVLSKGRRSEDSGVAVIAIPSETEGGPSRVGLVVSGAAGSAVARNRIRRRLRATVTHLAPSDGFDIVIRADGRAAEIEFQELAGELRRALVGAGIECAR